MTPAATEDGWAPLSAPLALLGGLVLALTAGLVLGVLANIVSGASLANPPGWLAVLQSLAQDAAFVAGAVYFAARAGRPRPEQFGLRRSALSPLASAAIVIAAYVLFRLLSAAWGIALNLHESEKVLTELGANNSTAQLIWVAVFTCVVAPICEEVFFRGFFYRALRNWRGVWPAALITGFIFGAIHAGSAPVGYLVPLGAFGVMLCYVYERTGSLYPCIALHVLNNALAFGGQEHWSAISALALALAALAAVTIVPFVVARGAGGQ